MDRSIRAEASEDWDKLEPARFPHSVSLALVEWMQGRNEFFPPDFVLGRDVRHGDLHDLLPDGNGGGGAFWLAKTP